MNPADDADRALIGGIVGYASVVRWLVVAGFVGTLVFAI